MRQRSGISGLAMILGIAAAAYQVYLWVTVGTVDDPTGIGEMLGWELAGLAMVEASIVSLLLAVLVNIVGFFGSSRVLTLFSAILYLLALVLVPLWGFMGIPSLLLQIIAYFVLRSAIVPRRQRPVT